MSLLLHFVLALASAPVAPQDSAPKPAQEESASDATPIGVAPQPHVTPEEVAQRLASLYEGTLVGVQDGTDFEETPGYRRLLEIVSSYGETELRDKTPRNFERTQAIAEPDAWRGELVRVRGLLADEGLRAERLERPIGDHTDVFRAFLTEPDGSDGIVVDFLHPPPPGLQLGRDVIETEAVFVRMLGYENRRGEIAKTPYLIARDIRLLDTSKLERRTVFDDVALILIGVLLAYIVIRVVLSMRSGKRPASHDPERAARLIRERARAALHSRPANKP